MQGRNRDADAENRWVYKKGVVKGDAGVSDLNYQEDGFSRTEIENAVAGAD